MANICPSCGEAGTQNVGSWSQCLYCGKRWDLTTGDYIEDRPTFPGGGVTVGAGDAMTTTGAIGGGKTEPEDDSKVDLNSWTKAELQAELDRQGVEYAASATKAELIELFE